MSNTEPDKKSPAGGTLGRRVAKGTAWIVLTRFMIKIIGFVNTMVLARLLVPEDFGVVAIGLIGAQLLSNLSDVGLAQAVIKFRDANRQDLDTLFTMAVIRGVFIAGILLAVAPLGAEFYDDPRVFWVFSIVAFSPLITGFMNPAFYEFERDLDFTKEFIVTGLNKFASVAVCISIALIFRTYMAIIMGVVVGGFVQLILSYVLKPYRPSLTLKSFRKVFAFTGWLTGISFMAALNNKLDTLIMGRVVGKADLGNFYLGEQLSELVTREIADPMARAIYPGFASLQDEPSRVRHIYLQTVAVLAAIALPAALGFAFICEDAVHLLLGEKWQGTVPVIQYIAPVLGLQTILMATQGFALAMGRTHLVFWREFAFFLVRMPIFVYAAITYGFMGAVISVAALGYVYFTFNLILYGQVAKAPFWEPLVAARRSLGAAAMMIFFFIVLRPYTAIENWPIMIRLGSDIFLGGLSFVGAQYLLWRVAGRPNGLESMVMSKLVQAGIFPRAAT